MEYTLCMDCDYCKTDRKNEQGEVRCRRYSMFVNPNQKSCEGFYNEKYYNLKHLKLFAEMKGGTE